MTHAEISAINLKDYTPPAWFVTHVNLDILLSDDDSRVMADISFSPNSQRDYQALVLDGDGLNLESIALNGAPLSTQDYHLHDQHLTLLATPENDFRLTIVTRLKPSENTQLMGLYRSSGLYCTQCEAEGFRRITFFPDRPDIMAVYTTRITARKSDAPVLLSNGNCIDHGDLPDGWHYAVWHDPHPKPSYLFALVGGDLSSVKGQFITRSGRSVELGIYVEKGKTDRAHYALESLKRSMKWDEDAFGREYDLDVFNIVAVSDFNMGAMENKGLNIFNDKYILASPDTATDSDYVNIESIIAHEYFHNWTGNRITCRDWFQLCLKEGLTVFRDQEFTADQRSRAVKRISDVRILKSQQFSEDASSLAHPVRPLSYREINNFYTATVYEKGAEIIRMLRTLIGSEAFAQGMELYFTRYDGTAATVENFLACFEEVSSYDLSHFALWYSQAGTPCLTIDHDYDAGQRSLTIRVSQFTLPTPGQAKKVPLVIPVKLGLLDQQGRSLIVDDEHCAVHDGLFILSSDTAELRYCNIDGQPVLSLLREFSAPVILKMQRNENDLFVLLAHDKDPFNRWQASQDYASRLLVKAISTLRSGGQPSFDIKYSEALDHVLTEPDHAFVAQMISIPSEADLARDIGHDIDPDIIHQARQWLRQELGRTLRVSLDALLKSVQPIRPYQPDSHSVGIRALRNSALDLFVAGDRKSGISRAFDQFHKADNMTDRIASLGIISQYACPEREQLFSDFENMYQNEPLIMDKWFTAQATIAEHATLERVKRLMTHQSFSMTNPNRLRALIGSFAMSNPTQFHRKDGAGYSLLTDIIRDTDKTNAQVAARLLGAFKSWRTLESVRRQAAHKCLQDLQKGGPFSKDVSDILDRMLMD
jgi:aminopeptidase N